MQSVERNRDLIFDLGLHKGEDTEFYLKKGFRVVAVDANAKLCEEAKSRFASAVADKQLTIVNKAIAPVEGEITFYESEVSVWGTVDAEWAARNERLGVQSKAHTVKATTMDGLLAEHGVPYFMKVDIEGMDTVALEGLSFAPAKPKYISIESDKTSFRSLRREFEILSSLGYDRFKIVNQEKVPAQKLPDPPREGTRIDHRFEEGASGAFGEETPGAWMTAAEAIEAYKPIFLRYALVGDDPLLTNGLLRAALDRMGVRASWYDTHARLPDA